MAHIHFEVPDELHRAVKMQAIERGESIREAGGRLFRWYVERTDEKLLRVCKALLLWWADGRGYQADDGYYLNNDEVLDLHWAIDDAKHALAEARQQGGGEDG